MITKFTKEHYPQGYSRQDCLSQLRLTEVQLAAAQEAAKNLAKEIKTLKQQLKQGGTKE